MTDTVPCYCYGNSRPVLRNCSHLNIWWHYLLQQLASGFELPSRTDRPVNFFPPECELSLGSLRPPPPDWLQECFWFPTLQQQVNWLCSSSSSSSSYRSDHNRRNDPVSWFRYIVLIRCRIHRLRGSEWITRATHCIPSPLSHLLHSPTHSLTLFNCNNFFHLYSTNYSCTSHSHFGIEITCLPLDDFLGFANLFNQTSNSDQAIELTSQFVAEESPQEVKW